LDAAGSAVDFTGITLAIVYEREGLAANVASLTPSVAGNVVTWSIPAAVADYSRESTVFNYSMRNAADPKTTYEYGQHRLIYAPIT